MPGENKINVQPIKTTTKDPGRAGALFVRILTMEHMRYDTGLYNSEPNVRVQAKDFADLCSQANTLKCAHLEIIGHNNAVVFKGILPNQTVASINKFVSQTETTRTAKVAANIDDFDTMFGHLRVNDAPLALPTTTGLSLNIVKTEDLMTVRVPIATVKALSKIHNISPGGTQLRFHFVEGKPTKLQSPIGTYGLYDIYLRNPRA
jgi:hypothetical protein